MDKFIKDFEIVAKEALLNEAEVTKEALAEVKAQISFIDLALSPRWAVMDFALIRLKIILKVALTEADALLLKEATKQLVKNESSNLGGFSTYEIESV
ncbi:MAG: hypothetical protein MR902_07600 [Campylobacter sp.]|nr:hypothetical protein [Campylobacter sp.]